MLNLKKTAVAVLALGSSAVFAGTMGPVCTPGNVTVPCENTAFDVGIYALYLKPSYSANSAFIETVDANGNSVYRELKNDWDWGFRLDGSYHFNTGNDLTVNWYHFNGKTTNRFILADVDAAFAAGMRIEPKWDAVNLEFGQHVDFGDYKDIRFHAGVQYARIQRDARIAVDVTSPNVNFDVAERQRTRYNGFGPRIGSDMTYNFGNGFAVYGNAAAAILVGQHKSSTTNSVLGTSRRGDHTAMVPELEAKLGMKYGYAMAQGDLTLDAGWMWVNYFDAQRALFDEVQTGNFALNGPYIGLKYVGNV
ncbi:MAG: hypothetical protein JJT82_09260 [Legionellaceae bacterium]|nr:hypothetical protein [Legionellaceae bacterium]